MKGTINLNGRVFIVEVNAASPYLYKQIFHQDFLREIQESDPSDMILLKMLFIMVAQSAFRSEDILKLSESDFFIFMEFLDLKDWLPANTQVSGMLEKCFNPNFKEDENFPSKFFINTEK